ncbi:MAG: hypothetical protein K0U86_13320 [Planctomycetes bacterium]|nr:hypothetical protein [Planctomycetota bacterium]MCH9725871.1 hypothetical protein [Planctomycetota bacterium]MCH9777024.1 hypothetical protein [Planctomycetota bacterium]MCH9789745.1 hypothetical protein [Planctomycetota bacterium]
MLTLLRFPTVLFLIAFILNGPEMILLRAEDTKKEPHPSAGKTAVALNYCRASFYRIKKSGSKEVMYEEREKILNNLNLNGVGDEEVIKLYSSVLDEIGQVDIADQEKEYFKNKHKYHSRQKMATNALALTTDVLTLQFGNAVRNGANSWWDYRNVEAQKDLDVWRVDKKRMETVISRSTLFMDTFWKLAQEKNIPDEWLIRDDDLESLDQAMREPNPRVRLRILKRLERFMSHYPPYWYYVARTQQSEGQLFAASDTYKQLETVGDGFFRRDDMLASGTANLAGIRDYLGQPDAAKMALKSQTYSSDVWEANLLCSRILQKYQKNEQAEEAILRNLDVDLESKQSSVALLSLYYATNNKQKMMAQLSQPKIVQSVPVPTLIQCAMFLGANKTPPVTTAQIESSLYIYKQLHFGPDDIVITSTGNWHLHMSNSELVMANKTYSRPRLVAGKNEIQARFERVADFGNPFANSTAPDAQPKLRLKYPDGSSLDLMLASSNTQNRNPAMKFALKPPPGQHFRIVGAEIQGQRIAFHGNAINDDGRRIVREKPKVTPETPRLSKENRPPLPVNEQPLQVKSEPKLPTLSLPDLSIPESPPAIPALSFDLKSFEEKPEDKKKKGTVISFPAPPEDD